MNDQEIGALIAVIGLLSQLAGAVLLVGLFAPWPARGLQSNHRWLE